MGKRKAIAIPHQLAILIRGVKQCDAGWYAKAAVAFIMDGAEPETIPQKHLAGWLAIQGDIAAMIEAAKVHAAVGKKGGRPKTKRNQTKTKLKPHGKPHGKPNGTKRNQKSLDIDIDRDREFNPDGSMVLVKPSAGADARANGEQDWHEVAYWQGVARESLKQAGSAQSPSDHRPIDPSGKNPGGDHRPIGPSTPSGKPKEGKGDGSFDRKRFDEDPYDYLGSIPPNLLPEFAAWICGEEGNDDAKRCYGGFAKKFGEMALRNEIERFVGELKAGENIKRPGALFQSRIKAIWNE